MPAILDDPASPTIFRVSGDPPYPDPAHPAVPHTIVPRHVMLRDRQTVATVVPFASRDEVPESLLHYLHDQFNKEIEGGDTYPMLEPMPVDKFAAYWFQNFGGIMLLGHIESAAQVVEGQDWAKECLGTFYIKPNYPGRSSHVCNAGFIVTDASRNRGVGRLMGETYLEWAPKLGYKYTVFNLVYETNVASCKIWDGLGFKRIGRVKGAGNLKSHPDRLVDAIIYGRDLGDAANGAGNEELVSEERFDKIKFYLKYGRYPNGADRAEKSRLRSAATHYKLLDGDVLMLKDKEVISDPQRQYEIARSVHNQAHGGINKTTATIAERYHWSRIKETVSDVIRNCAECKDATKASAAATQHPSPAGLPVNGLKRPNPCAVSASASKRASPSPSAGLDLTTTAQRPTVATDPSHLSPFTVPSHHQFADPSSISILSPPSHHALPSPTDTAMTRHDGLPRDAHNPMLQDTSHALLPPEYRSSVVHPLLPPEYRSSLVHPVSLPSLVPDPHSLPAGIDVSVADYQPIDPQIIAQSSSASDTPNTSSQFHPSLDHHHHHHLHHYPFSHPSSPPIHHQHHHDHDPDTDAADAETFQALINAAATDDSASDSESENHHNHNNTLRIGVGAGTRQLGVGVSHTHTHTHTHQEEEHSPLTQGIEAGVGVGVPTGVGDDDDSDPDAAVDRDLEMLIETQSHGDDDGDDGEEEEDQHRHQHRDGHRQDESGRGLVEDVDMDSGGGVGGKVAGGMKMEVV